MKEKRKVVRVGRGMKDGREGGKKN